MSFLNFVLPYYLFLKTDTGKNRDGARSYRVKGYLKNPKQVEVGTILLLQASCKKSVAAGLLNTARDSPHLNLIGSKIVASKHAYRRLSRQKIFQFKKAPFMVFKLANQ